MCQHTLRVCESEVAHSCPTLCDPVDCSPPGSSVHGISQAKILEWVAISFSRGSSRLRSRTHFSCIAGGFFTAELSGKPAYLEWACLNLWGGTWLMADRDWPLLGHVGSSHVFLISFLGQRAGPGLPFSWWWWKCKRTCLRVQVISSSVCVILTGIPLAQARSRDELKAKRWGRPPPSHPQWEVLPSYMANAVIQGEKR